MTRPLRALREAALWVAAVIGTVCLLAAIAAVGFGVTPLIFRSGSMAPGIPTGSLAIAVSTPASELRPGDVVSVVWPNDTRVTHRLVAAEPLDGSRYRLETQGDANAAIDVETVTVERADRVLWSAPGLGYVLQEVTKPQWVFGLGVLVGVLLVLVFRGSRVSVLDAPAPATASAPRHAARPSGNGRTGTTGIVTIVVLALGASALANAPTGTLAAYTDTAGTNGTFATGSVAAPTITGCTVTNNFLGVFQSVTITWTMPGGYLKANARVGAGATVAAMAPVTPAPTLGGTDPGPYTYTYTSSLLTSLLGSLLGSTSRIGVRTVDGNWVSPWSTRTLTVGLAGLGTTCT